MMTPERWQKVRDVLEQAMELAPEKRGRFLDVACSSDPSLRSEVQSLLSASDDARSSFLESPPLSPAALAPGTKLGDYEIVSQIGSGGMGVVYRAKDLRLGRDVAIKVLPAHLSSDPSRLRRFEQEAQSAAALNHPNILAVYQLGTYQGAPYLVSELLEGETLREQLKHGALPQPRVLDYAEQIADGLNAAHERAIIHRDLKPENLFVTKENRLKILDFGLAKLALGDSDSAETLATIGLQTHPGMIAGTVGYMSPEQVRGEKLDTRTDLFSFGVVLYEMATGKRPFEGDTSGVTFEAILNRQPTPPTIMNAKVTPGLENIITKALEKDRDIRYQHASDIRADLKRLRRDSESGQTASHIVSAPKGSRLLYWLIPLATLLVLSAVFLFYKRPWAHPESKKQPTIRQLTANRSDNWVVRALISRDGSQVIYGDGMNGLVLLQIDTGEKRSFPSVKNLNPVSWFPDGTHLLLNGHGGEEAIRGLWKMSTVDGSIKRIVDIGEEIWCSLSPDGKEILFMSRESSGDLWVMNAEGREPRRILSISPERIESFDWSPNSKRVVFLRFKPATSTSTEEYSVESCTDKGEGVTRVFSDAGLRGSDVTWLGDGRIMFGLRSHPPGDDYLNLWSMGVDPQTGRAYGQPQQITRGSDTVQMLSFSVSADGKRFSYVRARQVQDRTQIAEITRTGIIGSSRPLGAEDWEMNPHGWTKDGHRLYATSNPQGKWGLYLQDLQNGQPQLAVALPQGYYGLVITPDEQWLLYTQDPLDDTKQERPKLMREPLNGGEATVVLQGSYSYQCVSQAKICVLMEVREKRHTFYRFDPLSGLGPKLMETDQPVPNWEWQLSPDGHSVAFILPNDHSKIALLQSDGRLTFPIEIKGAYIDAFRWAADNKHFYVSTVLPEKVGKAGQILSAGLDGTSKNLMEFPRGQRVYDFSVSPDGKYFVYRMWGFELNVNLLENF